MAYNLIIALRGIKRKRITHIKCEICVKIMRAAACDRVLLKLCRKTGPDMPAQNKKRSPILCIGLRGRVYSNRLSQKTGS